jgi:predicted membrane metal-binding protein
MMFLAGFVVFSFRAAAYSRSLSYVYEKDHVRGRVTSVSVRDDKIRLIVKSDENGPSRILITLDEDAASRSAGHAGCRTSEALERYGAYGYTGALIEAKGEYAEIPAAEDPGCFDYSLYMKSKGVTVRFKAYIVNVTGTETYAGTEVRMFLYDARENFISRFDEDTQGFIRGVIFGDKSGIDDDILEEFNNNSTGHILAVSGLHMGFLYSLLRFLTARKRTLPVSMIITAVILLYGEMTMWSPSTSRACIVLTVSLMASHLRRHSDLLTSISLAAREKGPITPAKTGLSVIIFLAFFMASI